MSGIVIGKLAFVTGAGSGIGRAVCVTLAKEGAKVIACDKDSKSVAATVAILDGANHTALTVDVTSSKSVDEALKSAINSYSKPPTIVVNSAGITRDNYLLKLTEDDFDQVVNVNLKGTFLVTRTAVRAMIEGRVSNGASVVNLGSIVTRLGDHQGQSNYVASKAGVEAMSRTASLEFAKFGVRVNVILPGFVKTPMTEAIPKHIRDVIVAKLPSGRMGEPEEIAQVVAFLCSDKSSFVNGACIEVSGGLH